METRTALVIALGGAATYLAYRDPALGTAVGIGVVLATLLMKLLR